MTNTTGALAEGKAGNLGKDEVCTIECMKIVITDIRYKMALAPLWSLTQAGYSVICGESAQIPEEECLGFYSKYCEERIRWPQREEISEAIVSSCPAGSVVLPVGRGTLRSFAQRPKVASRVQVLVSPVAVLDRADDKGEVQQLARSLGIPTPKTYYRQPEESLSDLAQRLQYPVILKHRNGEALGLKSWQRYRIGHDPEEFPALYESMEAVADRPVVQDYLIGRDVGVAMVMDAQSRPVDFFCYESLQEYPLAGGPTCLCQTMFDRQLVEYAAKLLSALQFQGLAMLDFKATKTGLFLLEVNPRLWGSAALATAAGASLFESWVQATMGQAELLDVSTCQPGYQLGARMKFFPHCLLAGGKELGRGHGKAFFQDLGVSLHPGVPDGVRLCGDRGPGRRYLRNLLRRG